MLLIELALQIRDMLWGPLLILLLGVGIYQTFSLRGLQFRHLKHALANVFWQKKSSPKITKAIKGDLSSFQSLMTSLAGAIGTGNITGIAIAVATGGFGALFWMWVIAFFSMATAYSETVLAIKYRTENKQGQIAGGPMYTLLHGLKAPRLAFVFSLFGAIAAIGFGAMVQANSVADAITTIFIDYNRLNIGIILAIIVGAVILGGITSIGRIAAILVPFMAITYLLVGLYIIFYNFQHIGNAFKLIIISAFSPQAAVGAFTGSSITMAIRMGAVNGVFANEAGLGSLAIAGASAKCITPGHYGMFAISGVFSTMLVCTITGLVLAVTNVLGQEANGQMLSGSPLALAAFASVKYELQYVVLIGLFLFALTTSLAWAYYGEKCIEYLLGEKFIYGYRLSYIIVIVFGAILKLELVWTISHIMNGLMAIPNLISIIGLSRIIKEETNKYIKTSI